MLRQPVSRLKWRSAGRANTHVEELKIPVDSVGKTDELLKGVDVSVSEDADKEADEDGSGSGSVEAVVDVVDGAPSMMSGIRPERDTLGNASPRVVRPAVTPAGVSTGGGATGSERRVETLVVAPVPSM